jgi:hypothetical protein
MQVTIDEVAGTLNIVLPLQEPKESASGKTLVIASTHGNVKLAQNYKGKTVTVGVNAYISK